MNRHLPGDILLYFRQQFQQGPPHRFFPFGRFLPREILPPLVNLVGNTQPVIAERHCPGIIAAVPQLLLFLTLLLLVGCDRPIEAKEPSRNHQESEAQSDRFVFIISPLVDPDRLDTLKGKRAATPRLRKACYWLNQARSEGYDPAAIIDRAHAAALPRNPAREDEQKTALLRNLKILERLGCLDSQGLEKLRKGNAPTITKGPYTGELATADHIIPRSICPELDNAIFNLEFLPDTLNKEKSAKVGDRQLSLARRWRNSGLLSEKGMESVLQQVSH